MAESSQNCLYADDGFDQLLDMENFFCIHHQKTQRLLTEIYKAPHDNSWKSFK